MTDFTPEAMSVLYGLIPEVAKQRHRWYPEPSVEDLEAELWVAAVEQADWVEEHADNAEVLKAWFRKVARRAQKAEERTYRAERAYACGFHPADEAFYSLPVLRSLLPAYLDQGVTEHPPQGRTEALRGHSDGAEYGTWLVMMLDIQQGLEAMPAGQARLLENYFSFPQGSGGWTHVEIAGAMGVEPDALYSRVYRALGALQRELGGPSPG